MAKVYQIKWLGFFGLLGINLFGRCILIKNKADKRILNHEMIHSHQWRELGICGFLWLYYSQFIKNLWTYRSVKLAYEKIILEIEAYENDHNEEYLKTREPFQFRDYKKKE